MLLLDLTHTSHTRARTGIQRVCRSLRTALEPQVGVTAVCHDPHLGAWRPLRAWEEANLASRDAGRRRGARWPLRARLGGHLARLLGRRPALPAASGLVVPEIFSPAVAAALPALQSSVRGPCVALFHDAIALRFPELSPPGTVTRFPAYLQELLAFDGIAAVSDDSRDALRDYWRWLGAAAPPPVETLPLGIEDAPGARPAPAAEPPVVLSVGTLEARKNHLPLLEACEELWRRGVRFELRLIGLAQPQTGRAALERVRALQAAGRPLRYDGPVSDDALVAAYRDCTFTVYPSLVEGFGLPVLESLQHGRPCVCSARGALGESARGGGCLALDEVDARSLADAIGRLLADPAERTRLAAEAAGRPFRTWSDYARALLTWMRTLPPRDEARPGRLRGRVSQ